jgi:DNA polymerase III delta prime subunit
MPAEFIACQQGFNGPQVMDLISKITNRSSINCSGLHYIIIDEVDNLTKQAQASLKSALNSQRCIFILTTNNLSILDKGMLDRCVLIEMNAGQGVQLLPLAKRIAEEMKVDVSDIELLPTVMAANGSFRNLTHNVRRLIHRKAEPTNIIF